MLSWIEEEDVHVVAVRCVPGVVVETWCAEHRETVYVLARDADRGRLYAMGFTVRMPPSGAAPPE